MKENNRKQKEIIGKGKRIEKWKRNQKKENISYKKVLK